MSKFICKVITPQGQIVKLKMTENDKITCLKKLKKNGMTPISIDICREFTRSKKKYYKLTIMGRTGKKNPRLGEDFLVCADEETIIKVIKNTYKFVEKHISPDAPAKKEHIGYIIDRTGFEEYKKYALEGVEPDGETKVNQCVYWSGIHFDR